MTDSTPRITFQTAFGDDGDVELAETSVKTSLEDFGATVDHRERATRCARPVASEFGVDDRPEVQSPHERESNQSRLVAAADDEQRTLADGAARQPPLYEQSTEWCDWAIFDSSLCVVHQREFVNSDAVGPSENLL